jgi:hypothetical protein
MDRIAAGAGSGIASSSYAETATLPLRQRNTRSAIAEFRNAASTAAGTNDEAVPIARGLAIETVADLDAPRGAPFRDAAMW